MSILDISVGTICDVSRFRCAEYARRGMCASEKAVKASLFDSPIAYANCGFDCRPLVRQWLPCETGEFFDDGHFRMGRSINLRSKPYLKSFPAVRAALQSAG